MISCNLKKIKLSSSKILFGNFYKFRKRVFHSPLRQIHQSENLKSENILREQWEEKMKIWLKKYEDLFGITKLSEMHARVLDVQNNIQTVQEKRRKVQEEIFMVQKKLHEMQDILHKTSMGDDMYISVVTQVRELLKEQKQLQDIFSLYDQTEREQQTTMALSINNSQDHEKTYREKNKYLSLITGVVGGIVGLIGSSINNWRHRKEIKNFAHDVSNQVNELKNNIGKIGSSAIIHANDASGASKDSGDLLLQLKLQQELFEENVKTLQILIDDRMQNKQKVNIGEHLEINDMMNNFENIVDTKLKYHTLLNTGVFSSLIVFSALILYIVNGR